MERILDILRFYFLSLILLQNKGLVSQLDFESGTGDRERVIIEIYDDKVSRSVIYSLLEGRRKNPSNLQFI